MPARPATLKDPGTPDQLVMEQHSLTHFPGQPWCKMCVESRGHDSPHREQSKIDAVAPQLQLTTGTWETESPLQIAIREKRLSVGRVDTKDNIADLFTKHLDGSRTRSLARTLGLQVMGGTAD